MAEQLVGRPMFVSPLIPWFSGETFVTVSYRVHHRIALAIVAGFCVLGVLYSVVNPILESPDEIYHYPFIKHLADGNGLPVQRADQDALWGQEGSQPPLYYVLSALLTSWIDTDDLTEIHRLNPHARIGIPLAEDNKNVLIHTDREGWPWRGTVLAVHLVRLFSVALGAGTVWCTYRLTRVLFPDRPALALGAMGVNAFIPMFLFISASINNDNLVTLLASLALLLITRHMLSERPSRRTLPLLGVVIGLACLSKLSGLALLPLAALALALDRGWRLWTAGRSIDGDRIWREAGAWCIDVVLIVLPALAVAGWWYLRNWRLYGDPTGLNMMLDIFGRRSTPPSPGQLLGEFQGLRISFWGLFGLVNVLMRPLWIYGVLDALSLIALVGLGVYAWRELKGHLSISNRWPVLLVLLAWIAAISLALVRWTSLTKASQGRLLYPAIGPLTLLLMLGWSQWLPSRHRYRAMPWLVAPLLLLSVAAPFTAIAPAYARPPLRTIEDLPAGAQPYEAVYGEEMRLLAYTVERAPVRPGEAIEVTLCWEALADMDEDYSLYIHLFGRDGHKIGQRDSYHGGGNYPSSQWQPGDLFCDRYLVPVDRQASGPVAAELEVGVYRLATQGNLPVSDSAGNPVGRPVLTRVKVRGSDAVAAEDHQPPQVTLDANLGHRVRLVGYDLDKTALRPGVDVPLTLHWQVEGAFNRDYTVFIHALDAAGQVVGQGDGPPLQGSYPTTFWAEGERLLDTHHLRLRGDAHPGTVRIVVGLYHLESGERLPVYRPDGQMAGDHVVLTISELAAVSRAGGEG